MVESPRRWNDPPAEPPAQVSSELLWRVAARLYRDHTRDPTAADRCVRCPQPWPCSGRRLAELGLVAATSERTGLPRRGTVTA